MSTNTFQDIKSLYLHGSMPLLEKPVNLKILEVLFEPDEIVTIEVKPKQPEVIGHKFIASVDYGTLTSVFSTSRNLFNREYRLFSHPWGGLRPKPAEETNFPVRCKIVGTLFAFKWFDYQTQERYRNLLKMDLEIALSGKTPVVVLIDQSPPTRHAIEIVEQIRSDGLVISRIEEGSLEEALKLYKSPHQSEIDTFVQNNELSKTQVMSIDITEYQNVFDTVMRSIRFFESLVTT